MSAAADPTPRRVILLGASNVALSFPTLVETARHLLAGPLDLLAAFGHGRSYGVRMRLLWRELPGIIECGLWPALRERPPAAAFALLTDVGNDLLYDFPVPDIAAWVETCLGRLRQAGARVVMTPLPLENLLRLSKARFLAARTILFPGCRLSYATVWERALDLDGRLRSLARQHGAAVAEHRPGWYGLDPIHIRRGARRAAWLEVLSHWSEAPRQRPVAPVPLRHSVGLWRLAPECRWLFGRERRTAQPAARLPDGTTIALY